jgi:hypothetical protein
VAGAHSALANAFGLTAKTRAKKKPAEYQPAMKEPLKNGQDLNSRILAAQIFPLRCTRGHRHLNNYLCDRGLSEKFQKKTFF